MTNQVSLVDKRMRDGTEGPMIDTNNKRRKVIAAEVTKVNENKTSSTKVDPTELASAFALASLASISTSTTPRTNNKSKQDKEDSVKKADTFEEARSPKPEEPPMSPEHRNSSHREERSEAPKEAAVPSSPSTPEDSDITMSRRVHYAPHGKHFMPSPATPHAAGDSSIRSPAPPTPNPTRRLIVPPRQMAPRPPAIHLARPPPPHYMSSPMNSGFARFPSPRQAHMHPQHMFHPHSPHHHSIHHPQNPHHLQQSPRGWYSAPNPHMYPPPRSLMQPPLQHPEKPWICDHCNVAAFATYEGACSHEAICRHRLSNHAHSLRSGSEDERIGVEEAPQSKPAPSSAATVTNQKFYEGSRSLSMKDDNEWLSEINCFVRDRCIEVFSATPEDVARTSKRAGRLVEGQVGIRCTFCTDCPAKDKSVGAISFPTSVGGIYDAVKRWQRIHLEVCEHVPENVRTKLNALANSNVWVPTTRQYWADSALALGMMDTPDGIRFAKDPSEPVSKGFKMKLARASAATQQTDKVEAGSSNREAAATTMKTTTQGGSSSNHYVVAPEDQGSIPPYVHFLMSQVEPCQFTEADRFVARSKGPVGYPGFQCRHCNGHAGLGKYFPVSSKSLATNSTSQNIHAHLLKCRKCPQPTKDQLLQLKIQKSRSARMEPGWRKIFFDKVWARLHAGNNGVKNM
ncbi:unnamed protein product [Cylindrotheca closterium]|uniref:Uncharacterized protein n=1 Tax=Cylindrotheca closterium TaxID=2856 RepID=A0AAD2FR34_9STRA|nr:unnamed protein product [Cylindrotheca closterium]